MYTCAVANCNLSNYKKQMLARFRTINYGIEIDRLNVTERSNRICYLRQKKKKKDIGDKFYYVLCCIMLKNER